MTRICANTAFQCYAEMRRHADLWSMVLCYMLYAMPWHVFKGAALQVYLSVSTLQKWSLRPTLGLQAVNCQNFARMSNFEEAAPFDLPYEHVTGVPLNFNFWIRRNFIETEKDISDLIIALLVGDQPKCMGRSCNSENPVKVVLAIAQGVDTSVWTGKNISSSSFFSQCSTVPVSQQERSDIASNFSKGQPTDTIYNTLLWPVKPPCSLKDMKPLHSKKLFLDFALSFRVRHTFQLDFLSYFILCCAIPCYAMLFYSMIQHSMI